MITPSFGLTATERVLPAMALDFTTASLDARVTIARALNTATRVNSSGFIEVVNANLPRFTFDPITLLCRGLLREPTRTNLIRYSSDYSQPNWTITGVTTVSTDNLSPDGTNNAFLLEAANEVGPIQGLTVVSGASYTMSAFVKAGTATSLRIRDSGASAQGLKFVFATKSFNTITAGVTGYGYIEYANGWFRIWCTYTTSSAGASTTIRPTDQAGTTTWYEYGVSLEAGAFLTSYIPTTASAGVRNADTISMTGTNFSDWFNASAGTFFINTDARNAETLLTAGTYTLSADATALKKYATTYTADPSATELVFGNGTIQKVSYYKQALIAAELAALVA
jgi:hypothetical protein